MTTDPRTALLAALDAERFQHVPQARPGSCSDGPTAHLMRAQALALAHEAGEAHDTAREAARFTARHDRHRPTTAAVAS